MSWSFVWGEVEENARPSMEDKRAVWFFALYASLNILRRSTPTAVGCVDALDSFASTEPARARISVFSP